VSAPDEYLDLVLIPAMLHIDPLAFMEYPPALAYKLRVLVMHYIAAGGMAHGG
jgi:hypothetical protein